PVTAERQHDLLEERLGRHLLTVDPHVRSLRLEHLQGQWQATDMSGNGQQMPPETVFKKIMLSISGDRYTFLRPGGHLERGTYRLVVSQKPNTIDMLPQEGVNAGKKIPGICAKEADELRLCLAVTISAGTQRPTDLRPSPGDGQTI